MNEYIHAFWALVKEVTWVNHELLSNKSEQVLNLLVLCDAESICWGLDLIREEKFIVDCQQNSLSLVIDFLWLWEFLLKALFHEDVHSWVDGIVVFLDKIWSQEPGLLGGIVRNWRHVVSCLFLESIVAI